MGIGADFALVGKDLIRFLLGPGWEEAGRIFALFGPGIGVMLLYNTHGWIHLSIGRPERWFRWGLIEFGCTASLFLLALRWGPSGIALAWTISVFSSDVSRLLVRRKADRARYWAGIRHHLEILCGIGWGWLGNCSDHQGFAVFCDAFGGSSAFVRMVSVSLVFFGLYLGGVIALHQGLKPLNETVSLLRDLLPERRCERQRDLEFTIRLISSHGLDQDLCSFADGLSLQ